MEERLTFLSKQSDMETVTDWIQKYHRYTLDHLIVIDALQESIIKEEISRIDRDRQKTIEFDSLAEELMTSLEVDNQYVAEKVFLDNQIKLVKSDSDLAIRYNQQLILIKNKQRQLSGSIIDSLKVGLQDRYDDEDKANLLQCGFLNDDPTLAVSDINKIEAVLLESYRPSSHSKPSDFINVYLVQPWLADETVEDVRFEEMIDAKELKLGKMQEELSGLKYKLKDATEKVRSLESAIGAKGLEIELNYDKNEEDDDYKSPDALKKV